MVVDPQVVVEMAVVDQALVSHLAVTVVTVLVVAEAEAVVLLLLSVLLHLCSLELAVVVEVVLLVIFWMARALDFDLLDHLEL